MCCYSNFLGPCELFQLPVNFTFFTAGKPVWLRNGALSCFFALWCCHTVSNRCRNWSLELDYRRKGCRGGHIDGRDTLSLVRYHKIAKGDLFENPRVSTFYCEVSFSSRYNSYSDPFYHPISYSPTNKEDIDRALIHARKILTPHTLVLQMLFSRLQAARYHRPGVMLLIQHLVLRSTQPHTRLRLAFFC